MKTNTLKQFFVAIVVGFIFALALNSGRFYNVGFKAGAGQFFYIFLLMAGTTFVSNLMMAKGGRNNKNMRVLANKLYKQNNLILDDLSQMPSLPAKERKGWLYLTKKTIIFANNPDPDLIEKKAIRIPISKIYKVEKFKPTIITNDGLRITVKPNQIFEFNVGKVDTWIEEIEKRRK